MFGTSETMTDPPFTGGTSQADISQISAAALMATTDNRPPDIRPHLRDLKTGRWVLLDSGATTSVWPRSLVKAATADNSPALKAANGSAIPTYGRRTISLRVGPTNYVRMKCWVADVKNSILGWDYMSENDVEIRHQ